MRLEHSLAHYVNNFPQKKPFNNPVAYISRAILCSEFPSIQRVGSVGGGTSQDPGIVDRIKRRITTMLFIISMLCFLYTMLTFICSRFIRTSISHCLNSSILTTRRLFESWPVGATLHLLLLFILEPGEADDQSTTKISMMMSAWYLTISMIVMMTIQNPTTSLFCDHPAKQWATGHRKCCSRQHLLHESRELNQFPCRCNHFILSIRRSILSGRRMINTSLRRWHARKYPIKHLNY